VDGLNIAALLSDTQIAPQIETQIKVADVLIGTKAGLPLEQLQALSSAPLVSDEVDPCDMLLSLRGEVPETNGTHAHFVKWTLPNPAAMELGVLQDKLARRPAGLYRVKGFVPGPDGMFAVQVVGQSIDITPSDATAPAMVGIGPEGQVTLDDIATWWAEP
ncbi:MAG: GTP-binding protein, partial [Pseudomonadota bacterium]